MNTNLYGSIWNLLEVKNVKERRITLKFFKFSTFQKNTSIRFDANKQMFFLTNPSYNVIINLNNSAVDSAFEPSIFYYFRSS